MDSPGAVWGRDMKRSDLDSPGHSSLLKPAAETSKVTGNGQMDAQPTKKGRGRKQ